MNNQEYSKDNPFTIHSSASGTFSFVDRLKILFGSEHRVSMTISVDRECLIAAKTKTTGHTGPVHFLPWLSFENYDNAASGARPRIIKRRFKFRGKWTPIVFIAFRWLSRKGMLHSPPPTNNDLPHSPNQN